MSEGGPPGGVPPASIPSSDTVTAKMETPDSAFSSVWKRRFRKFFLYTLLALLLGWLFWRPVVFIITPDVAGWISGALSRGGSITDRNGKVLRFFPDEREEFSIFVPLASCTPRLIESMIAAEDKNFFAHPGFDVTAILRAAWLNLKHRRVVSGASTITQQLIRIVWPRPRTLWVKLTEIVLAAKLEQQISKSRILEAYLNLAPMSGNMRGVGIASNLLFGRGADSLTVSQGAVLAALPQSPSRMDPGTAKGRKLLLARRNWILEQMVKNGNLTSSEGKSAQGNPLEAHRRALPFRAPHFVEWIAGTTASRTTDPIESGAASGSVPQPATVSGALRTSLDLDVQEKLETVLGNHRNRLGKRGAFQAAGMIVDTRTMEILAMAGSLGYGPVHEGYNNGCLAPRSGGSILKPFLYALALENGFVPSSEVPDTTQTFRTPSGDYLPVNSDRRAYGPVSIRSALGNSLNISAVRMLNAVGIGPFFRFLVSVGLLADDPKAASTFGLGLAIGNPELRMVDLAAAYGTLANGGILSPLRKVPGKGPEERRVLSSETAFMVLDILADPSARLLTFGNPRFFSFDHPVALKTGTSTNYRDCWLFAATPRLIIGLWVGNFDGRPTYGLGGATACGPILHDLLSEIDSASRPEDWFAKPKDLLLEEICGFSGRLPSAFCPVRSRDFFPKASPRLDRDSAKNICSFHATQGDRHELGPEYAGWLQERRGRGVSDPFILTSNLQVSDPLEETSYMPLRGVGVRLRSVSPPSGASPTSSLPPGPGGTKVPVPLATGSLRIGLSEDGETIPLGGRLQIVAPHSGDRFVLSDDQDNLVRLRAIPEEPLPEIVWLVDGREIARVGPPYEAFWEMTRGLHEVTALGPGEEAAQIRFTVE